MCLRGQLPVFVIDNIVEFCSYFSISLDSCFVLLYAHECLSAFMYVQRVAA